ncbi:MAG: zinc ribbon domain-containing protein [Clostridia bacterium]|nr:zinc ribbon domain-containing protein [Clostridia bacterium]
MRLVSLNCPNCNAAMQADAAQKELFCPYCGSKFAVDDEVNHIQYDNAEQAGYEFEKGRQRAQAEQQAISQPQPQKKRKTWLWVLGWIFFFPIPLTIIIVRSQKLNKTAKIILLCVLWALFLLLGFAGEKENTGAKTAATSPTGATHFALQAAE